MTIRPGETEVTARIGGFRQLGGGELPCLR
jgi:hypothetical protein